MPPEDSKILFKRTDVRRAIRSVRDLGLPVERVEIGQDGKIVVVPGTAAQQQQAAASEEWAKATEQAKAKAKAKPAERRKSKDK